MSDKIIEAEVRYDETCKEPRKKCTVTLNVAKDMPGPVFVYYQLDNFYQNHRRYVKSRDNAQLKGTYKTAE